MKHALRIVGGIARLLLLAASIQAADPQPLVGGNPSQGSVPDNLKEYYYSGLAPEKLSYSIDLWYDAVLKGDNGHADRYELSMVNMVQEDIDSTRLALMQFSQYYERTQKEALVLDSTAPHGQYLPTLEKLDEEIYSSAWEIYKDKQRLFDAIRQSNAPSNKYRLITDYIDVLRRQIGLPKLKVVASREHLTDQGQQGSRQEE
ncbi:MAG: hypothetical protein WAU88_12205 [Candidatus Zixiibacteriota bacterium]